MQAQPMPTQDEQSPTKQGKPPGVWSRFRAASICIGIVMPTVAAALTGVLYIAMPQLIEKTSLLWVAGITIIAWLGLALLCNSLVTAAKVNPHSYGLLQSEMDLYRDRCNHLKTNDGPGYEAKTSFQSLEEHLWTADSLTWVLATGYITAWETMHRVKEALMEADANCVVVREAFADRLCIKGSTILTSDLLLRNLTQAIRVLDSSAAVYFEDVPTFPNYAEGQGNMPSPQTEISNPHASALPADPCSSAQQQAKGILRQVRVALNQFIDDRWEGLVHTRNLLLATITLTGLVVYLLLALAVVAKAPVPSMIAGMVFYIVGAIAGLFGWLYRGSKIDTTVDDYGLSLARLVATPLLSGLAGLMGVVITTVSFHTILVSQQANTTQPIPLGTIFTLNSALIIAAALFGLVPSLVIGTLLKQSQDYVKDLSTVQPSNQGTY